VRRGMPKDGGLNRTPSISILVMKRALGAMSMLLMLHLSVVGADNVCASHAVSKKASSGGQSADHHGMPMQSPGGKKDKCDTPISPACCTAMVSCAPTVAPPARDNEPLALIHASQTTDRVDTAPSRATAPEPPPPRA